MLSNDNLWRAIDRLARDNNLSCSAMARISGLDPTTFNKSKRARQLSAAKNLKDIQALMNLLQIDLEQCEEGLKNNFCDESEVEKVKKMIERATQRMNEIKKNPPKNDFSVDVLI